MSLFNLCRFRTVTLGTGALTIGTAVSGFLLPAAAGAVDGNTVTYAIRDGAQSEIGRGTYSSAGPTLARTQILKSTNSNTAIDLSGNAQVAFVIAAEDISQFKFDDGTAANPSITFASDTNTGIYRSGTDKLSISTNGIQRFEASDIGTFGWNNPAPASVSASTAYMYQPAGDTTSATRFTIANTGGQRALLTQSNSSDHISVAMGSNTTGVLGNRWGVGLSTSGDYGITMEHGGGVANHPYHGNIGIVPSLVSSNLGTTAIHALTVGLSPYVTAWNTVTPCVTTLRGGFTAPVTLTAKTGVYNAGTTYGLYRNTTNNIEMVLGASASAGVIGTATAHALVFRIANQDLMVFDGSQLYPGNSGSVSLGYGTSQFSGLWLNAAGSINWRNGGIAITDSGAGSDQLLFQGASNGYFLDEVIAPITTDGAPLGSTGNMWSDLFVASGAVINFNNGNVTLTHSAGALALAGGKLNFPAATTARAQMNLPTGGPPTTPVDGDIWREDNTNTGLKIRVNGVTKTITLA